MRRDLEKLRDKTNTVHETSKKTAQILEARPPKLETALDTERKYIEERKEIETLLRDIKTTLTTPTHTPTDRIRSDMREHLQPLTERMMEISSELKEIRDTHATVSQTSTTSLATELAQAEKTEISTRKVTYAQVAKREPARKPNHTLIVSSTDPNKTGDNVIEAIRVALDIKRTGVRVDKVRKARNQKVVLSCGTKEDLDLIRKQCNTNKTLKAEMARVNNPLIVIKDVLSFHTDAEIIEHLKAQNKILWQDLEPKDDTLKIRYRKKARNPHECHLVLELSPKLHRRFTEGGKVYIGLQRRPVEDQSPLVQCTKCLGFGHTKAICQEKESFCSFCGEAHYWEKCLNRLQGKSPSCRNCTKALGTNSTLTAHIAFSNECPEKMKWDAIARSRISYC